jgi:putative transposase
VFFAGITANPTGPWTTQQGRNLFLRHADRLTAARALVGDRGSQFVDSFDEVFRTEGLKILKTPVRTPVANAFAERWTGSLRRELLDRTINWNRRQLQRLIVDYMGHYNEHRPHRSLDQRAPLADKESVLGTPPPPGRVIRTTRCNGLVNEYRNAA